MSEIAIRVEDLGKRYRIGGPKESYGMLRDSLVSLAKAPLRATQRGRANGHQEFWALRDVSFDVKRGEVLGVIGRNGAGKSTLLKILSRITEPTKGYAEIRGRVGSLLEVGTGFHPELTGRENIYLNGAILGMKKAEIDRAFDEIVEFAEIEKFLDTPVKRYSSGMYMRLAFSIAAHLEPEILIVDEVLAVGDAAFQKKCLGKMGDVAKEGRTVLFVSHNMAAVTRLCQRTVWMDAGRVKLSGSPSQVASDYIISGSILAGSQVWDGGIANPGVHEFRVHEIRIHNSDGEETVHLESHKEFSIDIVYEVIQQMLFCRVGFLLSTSEGIVVFETYDADVDTCTGSRLPGKYVSRCVIPGDLLSPGQYVLSINAGMPNVKNLVFLENILTIDIRRTSLVGSSMSIPRHGIVCYPFHWYQEDYT